MADIKQLERALINADKAGDVEAARKLASALKALKDPRALDFDKMQYAPTVGMSGAERVAAGAGKALTDLGRGAGQMAGIVSTEDVDQSKQRDAALMGTPGGVAGNLLGNVAATLPASVIPGINTYTGAAATGGILGALQPTGTGESRVANTALGAAGGMAGQGVANIIGRLARPVQSKLPAELGQLATKAQDMGIDLTAAQKTGSKPLKIIDAVLENMPFTADRQAAIAQAQGGQFNRAALRTIGENADSASPEVLNAARTRIGQVFKDVSGRNQVQLNDDFVNALAQIDASKTPFSSGKISEVVDKGLELASKGKISGNEYQKIRTVLGKASSDAFRSGNSELGQALKSVKGALDDAADASISAADKAAWTTARKQWQALKVIEKAAAPNSADAVSGNVSPAKLAGALLTVDRQGFTYGTRGDELADLARVGQAFVKKQIPDSGTAQRAFYQQLLDNPLRILSGAAGIGSVPMQKLLNSKAGQKYLTQGLLNIPQPVGRLGTAGAVGAGGSLPLIMNAK